MLLRVVLRGGGGRGPGGGVRGMRGVRGVSWRGVVRAVRGRRSQSLVFLRRTSAGRQAVQQRPRHAFPLRKIIQLVHCCFCEICG